MTAAAAVRLAPPPPAVLRVVNPLVRRLLTSPCAGVLPSAMAVLEFTGRRSGRHFAVCVGVHEVVGGPVVFTEATWRLNFAEGRDVVLRRGGQRRAGQGVLVEHPEEVATALGQAVERVGPGGLALRVAPGHHVTHDDLRRLGRSMVRLDLSG